jgi:hypothetical protein
MSLREILQPNNYDIFGKSFTAPIINAQDSLVAQDIFADTVTANQFIGPIGGTGACIVTTYEVADSPATWTMNPSTKYVTVYGWAGGNGGGSGTKSVSGASNGGGSASPGGAFCYSMPASMISSPVTVIVGAGGTGGVGQTGDNLQGNPGQTGGYSSFGTLRATNVTATFNSSGALILASGNGVVVGNAGATTVFMNGVASQSAIGIAGQASNGVIPGYTGGTSRMAMGAGGGGAGGNTGTERRGGDGNPVAGIDGTVLVAGGTGGLESTGIDGSNGSDAPLTYWFAGGAGGGGGGGYSVGAGGATTGGRGGNGGKPGGGGGGGGGGINSIADSGAGGNGGDGRVVVIEFI